MSFIFTTYLKNDVFRVVAREMSTQIVAFSGSLVAFSLKALVAAKLVKPFVAVPPPVAPAPAPEGWTMSAIKAPYRLYKSIDRLLESIPGYKQGKNLIGIMQLWDSAIKPVLTSYVWDGGQVQKAAAHYFAPYTESLLRAWDKNLGVFLNQAYSTGGEYTLAALQESCAAQSRSVLSVLGWVCGRAPNPIDEKLEIFPGSLSNATYIEAKGEEHANWLMGSASFAMESIKAINQVINQAIDTSLSYGMYGVERLSQYRECVDTSGWKHCTQSAYQSAYGHVMTNYLTPMASVVSEEALKNNWTGPVLREISEKGLGDCAKNALGHMLKAGLTQTGLAKVPASHLAPAMVVGAAAGGLVCYGVFRAKRALFPGQSRGQVMLTLASAAAGSAVAAAAMVSRTQI